MPCPDPLVLLYVVRRPRSLKGVNVISETNDMNSAVNGKPEANSLKSNSNRHTSHGKERNFDCAGHIIRCVWRACKAYEIACVKTRSKQGRQEQSLRVKDNCLQALHIDMRFNIQSKNFGNGVP